MRSFALLFGLFAVAAAVGLGLLFFGNPTESPSDATSSAAASSTSSTTGRAADPDVAHATGAKRGDAPKSADDSSDVALTPTGDTDRVAAATNDAAEKKTVGRVSGVIVDYDGKPAPGVKIRLLGKSGGIGILPPDAETDANGRFTAEIAVKKKKTMRLRATRKDRLPITVAEVVLKKDETTDAGTLQFAASGAMTVRVVDPSKRPIPNIPIRAQREDGDGAKPPEPSERDVTAAFEMLRFQKTTDENGEALFTALPIGRYGVIAEPPMEQRLGGMRRALRDRAGRASEADAPEPTPLEPPAKESVNITSARTERLDLTFNGLGILTGRATAHRQPLANEWLSLATESTSGTFFGRFGPSVRARTDGEGKFAFPPVAPGRYVVRKGEGPKSFRFEDLDPDDGENMPARMAQGMFGGEDAPSDLNRTVDVNAGSNDVEVDFGGTLLEVIVQDADDSTPIPNAVVRLFDRETSAAENPSGKKSKEEENLPAGMSFLRDMLPKEDGRRPVRLRVEADGKGRCELRDLDSGRYRLIARVDERPPSYPVDVDLAGGASRVVLRVPKSNTIRGTINDHAGNPIEGAIVTVLNDRELEPSFPNDLSFMMGPPRPMTSSDAKGNYKLKGVEAGLRRVVAQAHNMAPQLKTVGAPSEGLDFFLEKAGRVQVTVRREGKPVSGIAVSLDTNAPDAPLPAEVMDGGGFMAMAMTMSRDGSGGFGRFGFTDENGVAVLNGVPPGDWTIVANGWGVPIEPSVRVGTSVRPGGGRVTASVTVAESIAGADAPTAEEAPKSSGPRKDSSVRGKARVASDQEARLTLDIP